VEPIVQIPVLSGHPLLRQCCFYRRKVNKYSLTTYVVLLIKRTPVDTDNGHLSVIRVTCSDGHHWWASHTTSSSCAPAYISPKLCADPTFRKEVIYRLISFSGVIQINKTCLTKCFFWRLTLLRSSSDCRFVVFQNEKNYLSIWGFSFIRYKTLCWKTWLLQSCNSTVFFVL